MSDIACEEVNLRRQQSSLIINYRLPVSPLFIPYSLSLNMSNPYFKSSGISCRRSKRKKLKSLVSTCLPLNLTINLTLISDRQLLF